MKRALPLIAVLLLAAGCPSPSGGSTSQAARAAASQTPGGPGPAAAPKAQCPPTAAALPMARQGAGRGVEMWTLLFPTAPELVASRELKIVFRLTGDQDVTLTADGPGAKVILPVWGPQWHSGSNFDHPGAEFGAGFAFPAAGCWRIRVVNESGVGELVLRVAPAAPAS